MEEEIEYKTYRVILTVEHFIEAESQQSALDEAECCSGGGDIISMKINEY